MYFVADDGAHGSELWRTDRTPAGTQRVTDLPSTSPFYDDGGPRDLTARGDALYFTKDDLWRVRGTGAPELIERGPLGAVQALGDALVFERDGQIWVTDGAPGAARWVAPAPASDGNRFASDHRVFDLDCQWDRGCSLWSSDGTPAGTGIIRSWRRALQYFSCSISGEHARSATLLLLARRGSGVELWRSDGTATALDGARHPSRTGGGIYRATTTITATTSPI